MSLPKPFYQRGPVTIYHGDCLELLPHLPRVDAVVTDPPYGIKRFNRGIGKGDRMKNKATPGFNNFVPDALFFQTIIGLGSVSVIWGMNNFDLPKTEHFLVWDKQQTVNNFASAEIAWANISKPAKVFRYSIHRHNIERFGGHPTEKPECLMQWCIEQTETAEGGTILDPFLGSGTTAVACIRTGRECIGIELEEKYCEIAAKRCDRELDQKRLPFEQPKRTETQRALFAVT